MRATTWVTLALGSVYAVMLIARLTAAALAETYVTGAAVPGGDGVALLTAAYPSVDLLLLALAVAAPVMLGRGAGWSWWLLCASFVTFFVTNALYAQMVADGTYAGGQPVDAGWLGARLLLVGAALASLRATESRTVDLEGVSVLALPGLCGLAVGHQHLRLGRRTVSLRSPARRLKAPTSAPLDGLH